MTAADIDIGVLECEPLFLDDSGNIPRLDPSNTVDVYLPSSMSDASTELGNAVDDWNAVLSASGADLNVVTESCGTGADCITLEAASLGGPCGIADLGDPPSGTGLLTGNLVLQLDSSWTGWSTESLQRTLVHELGHFLGLNSYSAACGVDDAIMQPDFVCGASETPGHETTVNDYLPANSSTYGNAPTLTCGW